MSIKRKKINIPLVDGLVALSFLSLLLLCEACRRDNRPVYQILEPLDEEIQQWASTGFDELVGPSGNPYADPLYPQGRVEVMLLLSRTSAFSFKNKDIDIHTRF